MSGNEDSDVEDESRDSESDHVDRQRHKKANEGRRFNSWRRGVHHHEFGIEVKKNENVDDADKEVVGKVKGFRRGLSSLRVGS